MKNNRFAMMFAWVLVLALAACQGPRAMVHCRTTSEAPVCAATWVSGNPHLRVCFDYEARCTYGTARASSRLCIDVDEEPGIARREIPMSTFTLHGSGGCRDEALEVSIDNIRITAR